MLISSQSPLLTTRAASSGVQSLRLYSDSYWKGIAIAFLFSVFRDMIDRLFFNRTVQKRRAEPPPRPHGSCHPDRAQTPRQCAFILPCVTELSMLNSPILPGCSACFCADGANQPMTAGACAKSKAPPGDGDLPAGDAVGVGAVGQIYGHTAPGVLQVEDAPNTGLRPS